MRIESCGRCGGPLVGDWCAACSAAALARFVHREIVVLLLLCGIGAVGFLVTRAAATTLHEIREQDAEAWFTRGEAALRNGRVDPAVEALRRAALMRREEPKYRLTLARALAAGGQDDAARQALLGLRGSAPENPEINLLLARLEARRADVTAAVRYYQHALYGSWNAGELEAREQVRMELIAYLLDHDLRDRALAELLIVAADLPNEPARHVRVGELFLASGEAQRALDQFRRALQRSPANAPALAGAARAAADLGDYAAARRYLRQLPGDPALAPLRATVDHVLASDPLAPRISRAERRRRAISAADWAVARLEACGIGEGAAAIRDALRKRPLRDSTQAAEQAVALLLRVEREAPAGCVADDAASQGWRIIARRHAEGRA